jgi:hypothetical protein
MKQIYFFLLLLVNCTFESFSQPFALALNNVNGAPYTCTWLDDLGTYKRLRVQANQNSADGRWELPQTCAYPGNVWRPYTDAEATPIPFNVVIPPTPSTYTALWNANNGGAPGRLLPVTNGNYYTFNVENITCSNGLCNSPHIGVLETPYLPVTFPTVTQSPLADAVGQDMPVTITVTSSAPPIENVFLRCRYIILFQNAALLRKAPTLFIDQHILYFLNSHRTFISTKGAAQLNVLVKGNYLSLRNSGKVYLFWI